jgi:hypothetical protein
MSLGSSIFVEQLRLDNEIPVRAARFIQSIADLVAISKC